MPRRVLIFSRDSVLRVLDGIKNSASVLVIMPSTVGDDDLARGASQQLSANMALKLRYFSADRGQRHP